MGESLANAYLIHCLTKAALATPIKLNYARLVLDARVERCNSIFRVVRNLLRDFN